jgi:hypothetical protein
MQLTANFIVLATAIASVVAVPVRSRRSLEIDIDARDLDLVEYDAREYYDMSLDAREYDDISLEARESQAVSSLD